MFWIGLIVGIITTVVLVGGHVLVCLKGSYKSADEFWGMVDVIHEAVTNRESTIQVWHDGEVIEAMTLEEME